jgi:hypothetical protein
VSVTSSPFPILISKNVTVLHLPGTATNMALAGLLLIPQHRVNVLSYLQQHAFSVALPDVLIPLQITLLQCFTGRFAGTSSVGTVILCNLVTWRTKSDVFWGVPPYSPGRSSLVSEKHIACIFRSALHAAFFLDTYLAYCDCSILVQNDSALVPDPRRYSPKCRVPARPQVLQNDVFPSIRLWVMS